MRVVLLVVRVLTLFGLVAVALNACGSSQAPALIVIGLSRPMEHAYALWGWISIPLQARSLRCGIRYAGIRRL